MITVEGRNASSVFKLSNWPALLQNDMIMTHMPLFIDLHGKTVVIFGGGHLGERKAKLFCNFSKTKVISRTFTPELKRMANEGIVEIVKDDFTDIRRYFQGAFLVVPATNHPKINALISDYAKTRKVLVNHVDVKGDVIVPTIISNDEVTVGISTVGTNPLSTKYLKSRVATALLDFTLLLKLQDEMMFILKRRINDHQQRRHLLYRVLSNEEVWSGLARSYDEGLKAALEIVNSAI